jgi:hypothetical protein
LAIKESYKGDPHLPEGTFVMDISPYSGSPLSPSGELMDAWWGDKITWKEFVERYFQEIFSNPHAKEIIDLLIESSQKMDIWLICDEKEYPCHRYLIKSIVERVHMERGLTDNLDDYSEEYNEFKNKRLSQLGYRPYRPILLK